MKILLTTLHAKYSHASLALPCLAACCREIPGVEIVIREWTVNEPREQLLRQIMSEQADLVAFSCYIWNIEKSLRIASDIKKVAPGTLIALGGPEASFGVFELMNANPAVDFVIKGEGEQTFRQLAETLAAYACKPLPAKNGELTSPSPCGRGPGGGGSCNLPGNSQLPPLPDPPPQGGREHFNASAKDFAEIDNLFFRDGNDIVSGPAGKEPLPLDSIPSPFEAGLVDLRKPLVYYETSRGCPFSCAFCLSSVEGKVRSYSMDRIMKDLLFLMRHNVSQIKLVDRTFNYDAARANRIWEFILDYNQGSHFHFEIAADLLTDENLALLQRVPEKTFRFEIGVQSVSKDALERVNRKTDLARISENVRRLLAETRIALHLDLVAGLPGEDYTGFLTSLRQVATLNPHEIQVEPLKVLKGSPMREIALQEGYNYSDSPPYTILRTPWLSFKEICRIETVGRLLDLFYNHCGFTTALMVLLRDSDPAALFDSMASEVGNEALSGLSTRRAYELFSCLALPVIKDTDAGLLQDALFFDYCQTEMPLMGKLPSFIVNRHSECAWPGRSDLPAGLQLPVDSRVKSFRFKFLRDYRKKPWGDVSTTVTFVYASGAGRGLRILVV